MVVRGPGVVWTWRGRVGDHLDPVEEQGIRLVGRDGHVLHLSQVNRFPGVQHHREPVFQESGGP